MAITIMPFYKSMLKSFGIVCLAFNIEGGYQNNSIYRYTVV